MLRWPVKALLVSSSAVANWHRHEKLGRSAGILTPIRGVAIRFSRRASRMSQSGTQEKLHLRVEGAEVVGGPALQGGMQRGVETEEDRLAFTHDSGGSGVE